MVEEEPRKRKNETGAPSDGGGKGNPIRNLKKEKAEEDFGLRDLGGEMQHTEIN